MSNTTANKQSKINRRKMTIFRLKVDYYARTHKHRHTRRSTLSPERIKTTLYNLRLDAANYRRSQQIKKVQ